MNPPQAAAPLPPPLREGDAPGGLAEPVPRLHWQGLLRGHLPRGVHVTASLLPTPGPFA